MIKLIPWGDRGDVYVYFDGPARYVAVCMFGEWTLLREESAQMPGGGALLGKAPTLPQAREFIEEHIEGERMMALLMAA